MPEICRFFGAIITMSVPAGYRNTGERALIAINIRWLHSAANDAQPISRMSCYASGLKTTVQCVLLILEI